MREDWQEVELGKLFFTTSGGTPSRKNSGYYGGNIPWVKSGELDKGIIIDTEEKITEEALKKSSAKKFPPGTLLIALYGATIGKLSFLGVEAATNQAICGIFTNPNFSSDYLYNYLLYRRSKLISQGTGGSQPNISQTILKKLNIPVCSIIEQRAIVGKIEELFSDLDKGVADLKKAQDQLKVYRQAVLKKAFEGELTKEWRGQQTNLPTADELLEQIKEERQGQYEQELENWKQSIKSWEENGKEGKKPNKPKLLKDPDKIEDGEIESYNNLPDSWLWSRLANTVVDHSSDIVDGPFGSNLKSTEYQDEGNPILRIQNIKSNQFIDKNIKYVSDEKYNFLERHQFKPNDVIVTKLGDPLGLACRVPLDFKSGVIVADLIRIRPSSSYINYDWLTLLINSIVIQSQFRKITKGTTRPRMNLTIMRNIIIPLPSYEEQHQIVKEIESRLSVCDKVEESITESLEKAEALRQSILKMAFEGRLLSNEELEKCKTAPDYEPAAVLLEKIKSEKK